MCCFTGPVHVSGTRIFARPTDKVRQVLAYQMSYDSKADVAMVLPLPTPADSADDALRFIDLEGYPSFFDSLKMLFPPPKSTGKRMASFGPPSKGPLPVVQVGSFEASFVPGMKAFSRLDARFRISDAAWKKLPQYADWGFAVFKLKKGNPTLHPMAFEFPRRDLKQVFFPTVHIHDGQVHENATFDHDLYLQPTAGAFIHDDNWSESPGLANSTVDEKKAKGLVDPSGHVYWRRLGGTQKNTDTWV